VATVLVVDDVAMNRELVRTLLGYRGHRVIEASEGAEALSLAHREHPDIVVTDVLMPGMDGYELAWALRADPDTAGAGLVFYSANYSTDELESIVGRCGVCRVVPRSGDPQLLLDAVDELLAEVPDGLRGQRSTDLDLEHVHTVNTKLVEKIRQLGTSEERFRVMAESSPVGIVLVEPDGNASYVNERLQAIMGLSHDQLLGRGWLQCFSPDLHDEVLAAPASDVQRRYRVRLVLPDERVRWLNINVRTVLDDEGRSTGAVGIVDDVTAVVEADERARAEARRQELDARLRVGERLDSLRRLAGGVAHDYNNLLAVILSFTGFVRDAAEAEAAAGRLDAEVAATMRGDLDHVLEAAQRATGLSRRLQVFGSRAVFHSGAVDLNEVIDREAEVLVDLVGDDVDVDVRLDPEVSPAMADAEQVLQVLQALISNARDAMPDGGALHLETANRRIHSGSGTNNDLPPGDYARLTVRDTGCGMSSDVLAHAIEPFFTTKSRGQGSGLGLATAYGIATQFGGDLTIESEPGLGTTVDLLLPAARPTARPAQPAIAPPRNHGGGHTVLVADDEDAVRELVVRMLRKAGYQVLAAADGHEAIALAEAHRGEIACLVTDVVMPRMLGSELAERLTATEPGLAVLFMSGYADPMLEEPCDLRPGVPMLGKPFREPDLLAAVQAVINAGAQP
jgi:PAS domain S-box-containing protein